MGLLSVDNGKDHIVDVDASVVAREYYTSYAKYVLEYRALPSVYDGLKPVQRRIIYTASQYPQKLVKTAKMSGAVLQYHPHGSSSITGAINEMAHPLKPLPIFNTKGNFGGVGFGASADRYTEIYLSEIARQNFCQFIEDADYIVGEIGEMEPRALPSLIPYCLFAGSEGIGIGLSTKVIPLNLLDIVDYYIDYIKNDGKSNRLVKPDLGYILLEMEDSDIDAATKNYTGKVYTSSVVTQISGSSFLIEGLFDRSIDAVLNRIDRWHGWIKNEQVGFRDSSTSTMRYVFEIYDTDNVSPSDLKEALVSASRRSGTFTRVVEEDGNAVYACLDYVVETSLRYLNESIDRQIERNLTGSQSKLDLYRVLEICKNQNVFDGIVSMTSNELVDLIIRTSGCSREVATEIVKKPISYLTRSHQREQQDLEKYIDTLKNHDRKKYLLKLYRDFRKLIRPVYDNKKHSITPRMVIQDPRIKVNGPDDIEVTDGDGESFDNKVYFVSDNGAIYERIISTNAASSVVVETWGDRIIGVVTDKSKYVVIDTEFTDSPNDKGKFILDIANFKYDKRHVNLDENETIVGISGRDRLNDKDQWAVKGSRLSKTSRYVL